MCKLFFSALNGKAIWQCLNFITIWHFLTCAAFGQFNVYKTYVDGGEFGYVAAL